MGLAINPARHNVLFELLRQQGASDQTCRRLDSQKHSETEDMLARAFLECATRSWDMPEVGEPEVAENPASAPEPRGYHEFFRAIRP